MRLIGALALVLMVAFNSCEKNETVITPEFPELKNETRQAGETFDITFNANLEWSIKSSAAWCKFINGQFSEVTTSNFIPLGWKGRTISGHQTISVLCSPNT